MDILILHGFGGQAGIHWQGWLSEVRAAAEEFDPTQLIIVGHSLGVTTALDYIETLESPLKALVSVSGFARDYGADFNGYFLREKTVDFDRVRAHLFTAVVIYGDNDPYVTQPALAEIATELHVPPLIIPSGGHLNTESGYIEFPELLETMLTIN